ncbi:MAG: hypothetical protein HYZ72_19575 [Deltaproteobacteria bacterium]|nr:hypothetical protein [Deltaproteobacteria bacterium]
MTDIEGINQLIWSMGVKFRAEMTRPAGPTPARFPVTQSFTLATTHNFFTLPDAVRCMLTHTTPEEHARHGKRLGSPISPLAIWMLGYHFLVGREILIDLSEVRAQARADKISLVLDCWRRLALTHRGDGRLDNSEAGATNLFLPPATVQQLYRALIPMDTSIRRRVTQFVSTLEEYLFLLNAEARLGIADSGPYPLNVERVLIVRDFFDLKGARYLWHEAVVDLPYQSCSLAFTLDPADFQSIELSDRSMLLTTPPDYPAAIREIALVSSDDGTPHVLLFTEMDWLVRAVKKAQPKLLEWFGRLSRREWIACGALPWVLRPFSLVAQMEDSLDEFAPEAVRLLPSYEDDDAQAARWATHRCLAPGNASAFVPLA